MMDDRDDRLKARFARLRAEEESHAPEIDATLARARRGAVRGRPRLVWPRLAAAALVLAAAGGTWLALRRERPTPAVPVWAWRSPTESLLDVPGMKQFTRMPTDLLPPVTGGIR